MMLDPTICSPIVTKALRYKDAAQIQAQQGFITWLAFRNFCAAADTIKRRQLAQARLYACGTFPPGISWSTFDTETSATSEAAADRERAVVLDLMGNTGQPASFLVAVGGRKHAHRSTGRLNDTHIDRKIKEIAEYRNSLIVGSLRAEPDLSDREHARRIGVNPLAITAFRQSTAQYPVSA